MKNKRPVHDSPKMNGRVLKRILRMLFSCYPVLVPLTIVCIIISSVTAAIPSIFLQQVLTSIEKWAPLHDWASARAEILPKVLLLIGFYIISILAITLQTQFMARITQGFLCRMRRAMFDGMQNLPIKYFDTHKHGDIMSYYTNDVDAVRELISQALPALLNSVIILLAVTFIMIYYSVWLTLVLFLGVFGMLTVSRKVGGGSAKYFIRQQVSLADVTGFVEERMNGQRVVKVFNHEDKSKEEFDKLNEALFESSANANKYGNMMGPVIGNIGNLQFVLTAVLGGLLSVTGVGGITLGVMASYLQFTKSFTQPFMQVAQQFNAIVMALAGAERIFRLIDEKPEEDEGYVELVNARKDANGNITECKERTGMWAWKHPHSADGSVTYTELTGDVRFEDVTFGYNPDKVILKDISLFAKPGQKLAFVGSTGAGKTTITNLINRFYDIQEGKIRYDGINITKIKKDDLRRSLGIVLQDTHLFTGTIKENIRYGKLDATDEEVYEAARLAHADQFIKMLPKGYDTMLSGDGEELSQGQRQLLSIARAAVANPPVLILDEATSSIDTRTESIVQKGMDNLMKGRTVFVIAHRLSTIRNSDAIIVLDHGKIIERGDHEDLIKLKGTYYQLYTGKLELS